MDQILVCLTETESLLKDYEDFTLDQLMTESDSEEAREKIKDNVKSQSKITEKLKAGVRALKNMIKAIIEKVNDMFSRLFMSMEEKEQFKKWEENIKSNPELANKKVTVKDFRKLNKAYDDAIKAANDARARNADPSEMEKILSVLKKTLLGVGVGVSVSAALKMAQDNKNIAKLINGQLEQQDGLCDNIEKLIGKSNTNDFKKGIEKASRDTAWVRFTSKLIGNKAKENNSTLSSIFKTIKSVASGNGLEGPDADKLKAKALKKAGEALENPTVSKTVAKGLKVAGSAMETKASISKTYNDMKARREAKREAKKQNN